jgi:hypothetical protein
MYTCRYVCMCRNSGECDKECADRSICSTDDGLHASDTKQKHGRPKRRLCCVGHSGGRLSCIVDRQAGNVFTINMRINHGYEPSRSFRRMRHIDSIRRSPPTAYSQLSRGNPPPPTLSHTFVLSLSLSLFMFTQNIVDVPCSRHRHTCNYTVTVGASTHL